VIIFDRIGSTLLVFVDYLLYALNLETVNSDSRYKDEEVQFNSDPNIRIPDNLPDEN
jgi:hypothetical protein